MKTCFVLMIMLSGCISGLAQKAVELRPGFALKEADTFDFKKVPEGPDAIHVFEFVNGGNAPLLISNVSAACGCTVAEWSTNPVLPRKKGFIKVKYLTDGRVGPFNKEIFVKSNATNVKGAVLLDIKGVVEAKDPELPARGS